MLWTVLARKTITIADGKLEMEVELEMLELDGRRKLRNTVTHAGQAGRFEARRNLLPHLQSRGLSVFVITLANYVPQCDDNLISRSLFHA